MRRRGPRQRPGPGLAGACEAYTLIPVGKGTELAIAQDVLADHEQAMLEMWPRALAGLKKLCEGSAPRA